MRERIIHTRKVIKIEGERPPPPPTTSGCVIVLVVGLLLSFGGAVFATIY